jgi:CHAD domain-containing protein
VVDKDGIMAFALAPDDRTVRAALRRLVRAELGAALSALNDTGQGPALTHQLRKHLKKTRGALRLVRPVFPDFATANAALRDGARHLADLRDAEVRLATLRMLLADLPGNLAEGQARAAVAALSDELAELRAPSAMAARRVALRTELRALRRAARDWTLTEDGWPALEPGLRRTWAQARAGLRAAVRAQADGGSAGPFHEWRKAVKHHWYQARLLAPVWPAMMVPHIAASDQLAEDLGAHNDLDVLLTHLAAQPDPAVAGLAHDGPLAAAARAARADLAARSLRQGARLLADRPGALARRWGAWWADWRATGAVSR